MLKIGTAIVAKNDLNLYLHTVPKGTEGRIVRAGKRLQYTIKRCAPDYAIVKFPGLKSFVCLMSEIQAK